MLQTFHLVEVVVVTCLRSLDFCSDMLIHLLVFFWLAVGLVTTSRYSLVAFGLVTTRRYHSSPFVASRRRLS